MNRNERMTIGLIQDLVGRAMSNYQNDRDPNRADNVIDPLAKAFNYCLTLLSKYPSITKKN